MARRALSIVFGLVLIVVLVVLAGFAALLVLSSSNDDTRHAFASPSGVHTLHLIETCRADACTHQAVLETVSSTGSPVEIRCGLDIAAEQPVFDTIEIEWLDDEGGVAIRYDLTETEIGTYTLDFTRDCNA